MLLNILLIVRYFTQLFIYNFMYDDVLQSVTRDRDRKAYCYGIARPAQRCTKNVFYKPDLFNKT